MSEARVEIEGAYGTERATASQMEGPPSWAAPLEIDLIRRSE